MSNTSRLGLNTTHLPPTAESTCLSGTTVRNGYLPWVNTPLGSDVRNSADLYMNGSADNTNSTNKIDARKCSAAQYHSATMHMLKSPEDRTILNRSMSLNTLYNRPGKFPIVHLQNHEIPLRAKKKKMSMTQIAAPDKFCFYGSTLSGLLRSNSIVGLHKSNDELSRENRPIIHALPAAETVPTRSVLDVLKEISRKRINNDDDVGRVEASLKKYCYRKGLDLMDGTTISNSLDHSKLQHWQQNTQPSTQKRQRENMRTASTPTCKQSTPEQVAKTRRLSNYNNDISSSLSSSLVNVHERKLCDKTPPYNLHTEEKVKRSSNKVLCDDKNYDKLAPTTHISKLSVLTENSVEKPVHALAISTTSPSVAKKQTRLTLFNKNCTVKETDSKKHDDKVKQSDIDEDYGNVQFVTPKKGTELPRRKHPLMQHTQKSKLALMLTGLRGELYADDGCDTFDAPEFVTASPQAINENVAELQNHQAATSPYKDDVTKPTTHKSDSTTSAISTLSAKANSITSKNDLKTSSIASTDKATILPSFNFSSSEKTDSTVKIPSFGSNASTKSTSPLFGIQNSTSKINAITTCSTSVSNNTSQTIAKLDNQTQLNSIQFGSNVKAITPLQMGTATATVVPNSTFNSTNSNVYQSNSTIKMPEGIATTVSSEFSSLIKPVESKAESNSFSTTKPITSLSTMPFSFGKDVAHAMQNTTGLMPFSFGANLATNTNNNQKPMFGLGSKLTPATITDSPFVAHTSTKPISATEHIQTSKTGGNGAVKSTVTSTSANLFSAVMAPTNEHNTRVATGISAEVTGFGNKIHAATTTTTNETVAAPTQPPLSDFSLKPSTNAFTFGGFSAKTSETSLNQFSSGPADNSKVQINNSLAKSNYNTNSRISANNNEKQQNLIFGRGFNSLEDSNRKEFSLESQQNSLKSVNSVSGNNIFGVASDSSPAFWSLAQKNNATSVPFSFGNKPTLSTTKSVTDNVHPEMATSSNSPLFLNANSSAGIASKPPSNILNIFSPPADDRPKRKATRRLHKP